MWLETPGGGIGLSLALLAFLAALTVLVDQRSALAQSVDDGSDAVIGKTDARTILDLIKKNVKDSAGAKVTALRRSKGAFVCGSINVKNKDGKYIGERGFVVDLSKPSFGRLPEGPELMDPRVPGFDEKERIRATYFEMCLD